MSCKIGGNYIKVRIDSDERHMNVPYAAEMDFGRLLKDKHIEGKFDRFSVSVKKNNVRDGILEDVCFNISDDFLVGSKGKVNWLIEDTDDTEYVIFFDTEENGPFLPQDYIGLVGNGDCLRHNDGKLHPLRVGMGSNPVAVDWDGDGVTDIISPQIYSHTMDFPWFLVRFFRNEGTNDDPVFGDGIPLRYRENGEYKFIEGGYCVDIVDWNDDGLPDLITFPYSCGWPYECEPEVRIYKNTGEKDETGCPVLEPLCTIPVMGGVQYSCIRVVDWFGNGRKCIFLGYHIYKKINDVESLWFDVDEDEKKTIKWPLNSYTSHIDFYKDISLSADHPIFEEPRRLKRTDGNDISSYVFNSFEIMDWDGDGKLELLAADQIGLYDAGVSIFKSLDISDMGSFEFKGRLDILRDRIYSNFRYTSMPAFKGFLVNHGVSSGMIRYYSHEGTDMAGFPVFRDRGFLLQRNAYVSTYSGYAQGYLCDWDNDGDLDIIMGCETGFVQRCENTGTRKRPVFKECEFLWQDGRIIENVNGPFSDDYIIMEAPLGQCSAMYADWDNDGILDLMVAVGRRLLFYENAGTSSDPVFLKPVEIRADGNMAVVRHRSKPVIMDWDGDGLLDIIGHDQDDRFLYFFKRYKDPETGELRLAKGIPLLYADGSPIIPAEWGKYMNYHDYMKYFNAGDWNNKGKNDLFFAAGDQMLYMENVGEDKIDAFLPPVKIKYEGKPIRVGLHVCTPLPVDWDLSGRQDLFVSGESGFFHLFRRNYLDDVSKNIRSKISIGDGA